MEAEQMPMAAKMKNIAAIAIRMEDLLAEKQPLESFKNFAVKK
jgi:hypothetical protein